MHRCLKAVRPERRPGVSMEFSQTLFIRQSIADAALPIRVCSSVSWERLLEMVEPK